MLDDSVCKEVNVAVNNEETRMMLIDHKCGEMSLEAQLETYCPDAVLVVLAVDESGTLTTAELILSYLKILGITGSRPVILVANKTDLVRSRTVKPFREYKNP